MSTPTVEKLAALVEHEARLELEVDRLRSQVALLREALENIEGHAKKGYGDTEIIGITARAALEQTRD